MTYLCGYCQKPLTETDTNAIQENKKKLDNTGNFWCHLCESELHQALCVEPKKVFTEGDCSSCGQSGKLKSFVNFFQTKQSDESYCNSCLETLFYKDKQTFNQHYFQG